MNAIQQRIEAFNAVRDIPYRIDIADRSKDNSCAAKAKKLQARLAARDIVSRRMRCRFNWRETSLPLDVTSKVPLSDSWHEYLHVYVPETRQLVSVDSTWDIGVRAAGLPVAEWDGVNATPLAVKPSLIYTPEMSASIIAASDALEDAPDSGKLWEAMNTEFGPFVHALNNWLDQQRQRPGTLHA